MGKQTFSCQYQQNPVPNEGEIIQFDWFQSYDEIDIGDREVLIYQSWDVAAKTGSNHDYSVCTTWLIDDYHYYLLDVYRARLPFPALVRKVDELAVKYKVSRVIVEDVGIGVALFQAVGQAMSADRRYTVRKYNPKQDKITRMRAQSAVIESGRVFLPRSAPWLEAFKRELVQFPHGTHDDQVDSLSQLLTYHERSRHLGVM